jgi:MoxR-like ATPase
LGAVAVDRFFWGHEPSHCQSTAFWVGPNGLGREPVSLRTLIGASNEAPSSGSELDALYDRFLVRLWVPGVSLWSDFTDLIHPKQSSEFDYQGKLTREDVVALQEEARNVVVPVSVTAFLYLLKW